METVCIYHGNCADGFTAAWAVWKRFGDAIEYYPGVHGEQPPEVSGKRVIIVDFSYSEATLREMARIARSIVILDHHKTAAEALDWMPKAVIREGVDPWLHHTGFDGNFLELQGHPACVAWFDMEKSGARLTWEFFHPNTDVPRLVEHVEDRDLWRFQLSGTREIQAAVFSFEYTFENWDHLATQCNGYGWDELYQQGAAIERKHAKDVRELLAVTKREMVIGGYAVPVANLPYTMASDGAGEMAQGEPFAATYYDAPGGRFFSLRSRGEDGMDVSVIAKNYGGDGHKNAAGFRTAIGWEGDEEPLQRTA